MTAFLSRLETSGRTWWGQIGLRGFGLAMLVLCAASARWLYGSVHQPPAHVATVLEFLSAEIAFLAWALGWAFVVVGPGLFERIYVPARHRRNIML